jgi:hypothetical protein
MRTRVLLVVAAVAILAVACLATITRGPDFHHYADARTWLGIPHAGDVLSNLAFILAAILVGRSRAADLRTSRNAAAAYVGGARAGMIAIGIGSAAYHVAPRDLALVFDWAPIALTLAIVTAAVATDRAGPRTGRITLAVSAVCAIGAVAWWYATGGTDGGNMAPYVAVQAAGIALPPLVALTARGAIPMRWLLAAVGAFALARLCGAHDRALLDACGISGHACKHIVAAVAAACALHALSAASPTPNR